MTYESFRTFADTWGLVLLAATFLVIIAFLFRRGSTAQYRRAARIPIDAPERPDDDLANRNDAKDAETLQRRPGADREGAGQ
ncbi:MAG: cbb3-type cytochrome c oxidase subunit 3 [Pseudomonadota bacterium]